MRGEISLTDILIIFAPMNPYDVLGVSANATDQEIKRAYRNLVKRYHPDRRSPEASHEAIAAINQAYDILSDPEKRAQYDRGFRIDFYRVSTTAVTGGSCRSVQERIQAQTLGTR